jgi:RNA polymerase sigma-70 factor (ECF subfamily)
MGASSAARFPTTQWSRILTAGDAGAPLADGALAEFCRAYWYPLYAFIRRRGHAPPEAADLTQELFARLIEKGVLADADPARGRFRSFLMTVCIHFLANQYDRSVAAKRGAGRIPISIDLAVAEGLFTRHGSCGLSPERLYDRDWAMQTLGRVLELLRGEYARSGSLATFDQLQPILTSDFGVGTYAEVAERLGHSTGAVRAAVHRLRQRYGALLRAEVAATLDDPSQDAIDDEIRDLFAALGT